MLRKLDALAFFLAMMLAVILEGAVVNWRCLAMALVAMPGLLFCLGNSSATS